MEKRKPTIREIKKRFMSGELFEPVHRRVDKMQAWIFDRKFRPFLNEGKKSNFPFLSDNEISELSNSTEFDASTYLGLMELVSGEPKEVVNKAHILSLNSLLFRKRMQRRGNESNVLGIGGPLYILQSQPLQEVISSWISQIGLAGPMEVLQIFPQLYGAITYWITRRIYLNTISIGAFRARDQVGYADADLVNFLNSLLLNPNFKLNQFINIEKVKITSSDSLRTTAPTRYINEWWGIGPAIAICTSSLLAKNYITPAISLFLLGVYQVINKLNKSELNDQESVNSQMVRAAKLKDDIQMGGLATSVFSPVLGASLIASVQVAQTQVTAEQYRTMKPQHDAIYQDVNRLIAQSIIAKRSGVAVSEASLSTSLFGAVTDVQSSIQKWFFSTDFNDLEILSLSTFKNPEELVQNAIKIISSDKYINLLDEMDLGNLSQIQSLYSLTSIDQSEEQKKLTIMKSLMLTMILFSSLYVKINSNNISSKQ
jgi:hypothetical protein